MKKLSFFVCFSLISAFAFPQWKWQNPIPVGNTLRSVFFTGANTGYVAGLGGTILKTIDGGTSWAILNS